MSKPPAQPIQGLIDGLSVMQELALSKEPVSSLALARKLGLETTKVNRLLKTLSYLGMAQQVKGRAYVTGPGIHVLAAQTLNASGLIQHALPYLEALHQHQMVVALGVLWRDQVSYLYHWKPEMTPGQAIGSMIFPATESSIGRVLLAELSEDMLQKFLDDCSQNENKEIFKRDVKSILVNKYAVVQDGSNSSISVKLGQPGYAGLALSGDIPPGAMEKYVQLLRATAEQIESSMHTSKH